MKKLVIATLLIAVIGPFSARSQQGAGSLASFMAGQHFAGVKLERRLNRLFVPVSINNNRAALLLDTGCPITLIDKNSVNTFKLAMEQTKTNVGGAFGRSHERYGKSKVRTIAMGNCSLTNVPVAIADESDMNYYSRLPHLHGLLGAYEMVKFGMVIDCTRQMLYINPAGRSSAAIHNLASFLAGRGFERIPMRLNSNAHFEVEGALNDQPTRFVVDTGATTTLIDKKIAAQLGIGFAPTGASGGGAGGLSESISAGTVKELAIGNFKIAKAEVAIANLAGEVLLSKVAAESNAGLLGIEYLSFNFAVLDLGGPALYLRHPD